MIKLTTCSGNTIYVNPDDITYIDHGEGGSCKVHVGLTNVFVVAHAAESVIYKMSKKTQVFTDSNLHLLNHDIVNFLLTNTLVDVKHTVTYDMHGYPVYTAVVVYR